MKASPTAASGMRPFDAENNWQALTGEWPKGWSGYVGRWGLFGGDGANTKSWAGARLFKNNGDDTYEQVNIYDTVIAPKDPGRQRPDGGWEKIWHFDKANGCRSDGWFHPYIKENGPLRSRLLGISPPRTATVAFALPLQEFVEKDDAPPPFWNSELFVRPAGSRLSWSAGVAYNIEGVFQTVFYIREARVADDPSQPLQLSGRPELPEPRLPLPEDSSQWPVAGGSFTGVTQELRWDDDGSMMISEEQPVEWTPPLSSHRLTRLPDAMYAAYPESLPTALADVPEDGVTIEFGGVLPGDAGFARTVLQYGRSGHISAVRFDEFLAAGSQQH